MEEVQCRCRINHETVAGVKCARCHLRDSRWSYKPAGLDFTLYLCDMCIKFVKSEVDKKYIKHPVELKLCRLDVEILLCMILQADMMFKEGTKEYQHETIFKKEMLKTLRELGIEMVKGGY